MHAFRLLVSSALATLLSFTGAIAHAEVVKFEITDRSLFAGGQSFGDVGPYERIVGTVHFAIDPSIRQNKAIKDLRFAEPRKDGRVEFSSEFFILAPRDLSKGNRALVYDVNNRGNKLALKFFNDATGGNDADNAGNGFLMRQGFTVVWSGWNGELLPGDGRLQLHAPVAKGREGPITGLVRYEMCPDKEMQRLNINRENHGAYRPTTEGLEKAALSWRRTPGSPRILIPRPQFRLHVTEVDLQFMGQLPKVELELPAGFRKGYLYELIYEAQNPLVHGVCFASVRDLLSSLRLADNGNPLVANGEPGISRVYGFGVSQSGRFLREFVYSGFNEDELGHAVFDGIIPHVAGGGLGSFNHRFAQPTAYSMQHDNHDWPVDRFPFAYEAQTDPLTGASDGILLRAMASKTAPKIMHTQSATEYWSRSGSLVHTDPAGLRDGVLPDNVRLFAFGGTQHGPASFPSSSGNGQTLANPGDYRPFLRCLLLALDGWCEKGDTPLASVYPTIATGTLVKFPQVATGFPAIPGIRYPEVMQQPRLLDLGSRWVTDGIIDLQPPKQGDHYAVLVPRCNEDGNELGCLLPPEVAIPVATYTGWSLRNRDAGAEGELVGLNGSYIPFPKTQADRELSGDPRRSVVERYENQDQYLSLLRAECVRLATAGYLLDEDVDRIVSREASRQTAVSSREPKGLK